MGVSYWRGRWLRPQFSDPPQNLLEHLPWNGGSTDVPELMSVAGDAGMEIVGPRLSHEEVRQIIAEVGAP
jgi:hypothetical protein